MELDAEEDRINQALIDRWPAAIQKIREEGWAMGINPTYMNWTTGRLYELCYDGTRIYLDEKE